MQNNNEQNNFTYTYSAKERDEVRAIRDKYIPREESKMDRLRRLDRTAESRATVVSLILGIVGTLILGFGMSLVLSELSLIFGDNKVVSVIVGVVLGLVGGAVAALAYPVYNTVLAKERERIAPEVIRLTDELMK
ncbi:MAG: hypothetical protein IJW02_00065 [Clostridia bacterium]|nr:hypothetical protein [Clostridia bacterium]